MILGNFPGVGKSLVSKFTIEELPKDRFVHNFVHVSFFSSFFVKNANNLIVFIHQDYFSHNVILTTEFNYDWFG